MRSVGRREAHGVHRETAEMKRLRLLLLLLIVVLAACGDSRPPIYRAQLMSLGTLVDITIRGATQQQIEEAEQIIRQELQRVHSTLHAWQPGTLLETNRRLASGEWFRCPPELLPLIVRARQLYRSSEGLFNPAIGKLVELWGFHGDTPPSGPPPSPEAIRKLLRNPPGMDAIGIRGEQIRSDNPALQLDFGAFAKGYAVDRIIERLRAIGIRNAIINAGGDLRAIGGHGERPWRIGIRDPRQPGVLASVELREDESVFTSGDYERFYIYQGERYHHILDPRSGAPARGVRSVTVIHHDAASADAAATALFVAGPQRWWQIARRMGIKYVMLVDDRGGIRMNPAMAARIRFETEQKPQISISEEL